MKKIFTKYLQKALQKPAERILRKFNPKIIAITGSVGKTSAKEAIFFLLSQKINKKIWKNQGNLNTKFGIPLAILGFKNAPVSVDDPSYKNIIWLFYLIFIWIKYFLIIIKNSYPDFLIIEISADKPGDIKQICSWLKPHIGVYTKIAPAHLEFFNDTKGVYEEKKQLAESLTQEGYLILNKLDPWSKNIAKNSKANTCYYNNNDFDMVEKAAVKVGEIFGIDAEEAIRIIKKLKPVKGRLNIIQKKSIIIIDDTYNSNPASASYALQFLKNQKGKRKIAFLGDMLELGRYEEKGHQIIAYQANQICDFLILVGSRFKKQKEKANFWFKNSQTAADNIPIQFQPGDVVLIKGSRGIKMENIIKKIT